MNKEKVNRFTQIVSILRYVKPLWGYMLFNCIICLVYNLIPIINTFLVSLTVGKIFVGNMKNIPAVFITVVILVILQAILHYVDMWCSHDLAYGLLRDIRIKAYSRLEKAIPAFSSGRTTGELVQIASVDIEILERFYAHTMNIAIVSLIVSISTCILMAFINPLSGVVIAITIVLAIIIPLMYQKVYHRKKSLMLELLGGLNALLTDGIQGMKDIWAYNWGTEYMKRFLKMQSDYGNACYTEGKRRGYGNALYSMFSIIAPVLMLIIGIAYYKGGSLKFYWIPVLVALGFAVFEPVKTFVNMTHQFAMILGAAERVEEIIELPVAVEDLGEEEVPEEISEIRFHNVSYKYPLGKEQVLKNVSFVLRRGEVIALAGVSGAGKSTIVQLIQRNIEPDSGNIYINGIDIRNLSLQGWRDRVSSVSQNTYLFNTTIWENVKASNPEATGDEIYSAFKKSLVSSFAKEMKDEYNTILGEGATRLSGGERQRISIARAILKNGSVFVLDEATSSLDSEAEQEINETLLELGRERIMLIIAHRVSTIEQAHKVIFMDKGQVVEVGSVDEMKAIPLFKEKVLGI